MKLNSTGPLEAMATSTLRMDLQQVVCILSLNWGKLSICTMRRRSRRWVYTSGTWGQGHKAGDQMRKSWGCSVSFFIWGTDAVRQLVKVADSLWACYLFQVDQDTGYRVEENGQLIEAVFLPVRLRQVHLLTALNQLGVHQVHVLWANFLTWLQRKKVTFRFKMSRLKLNSRRSSKTNFVQWLVQETKCETMQIHDIICKQPREL